MIPWNVPCKVSSSLYAVSSAIETLEHRSQCNRVIHEKLTGSLLIPTERIHGRLHRLVIYIVVISLPIFFFSGNMVANRMRLYQHTARCPAALEAFIDCNPMYRCFVPMDWYEAISDNREYLGSAHDTRPRLRYDNVHYNDPDDPEYSADVIEYLQRVPLPLVAYAFSYRQRQEQRTFFRQFITLRHRRGIFRSLDLYRFKVIAVRTYPSCNASISVPLLLFFCCST